MSGSFWFRNAIFYQALVGSFKDTTGSGVGTLRGVIDKLDYLKWLGVDCLWLSPFYASPMRDDGYDIADYYSIHPDYGTMADFEELVAELKKRDMRIMTDLALNHTSIEHEWFQQSRLDPNGPYGDYYVWGDDAQRYPEIRIIFTDAEDSNWQWDETRGQYYFHRFYSHQPDLNYDNPLVHEEVFNILSFWMDKGLDGFRLDAIPYLYERDGVGGESLPETIEFIEKIRRFLDENYPDAIMLAEANQPPSETMEFFGKGDRFHMVFNFPLMPRLFQAFALGDASPIYNIMAAMPTLPENCQWGTFVRNHDELTLEMVDEGNRSLLYSAYLPDDSMRAHVGIARRLAPLMGQDRRKIELMYSLLLTMPGSPFLYYGDEIGMLDDTSLPDRDAVRTPMQWEPGPGAGFTTSSHPRRPIVGGKGISVAEQVDDPESLLNVVRTMVQERKAHPELGTAPFEAVESGHIGVLAFERGGLLCLHNFCDETVDLGMVELGPYGYAWIPVEAAED
ncbi:alpha-amylase family protein [Corynebacterium flavescens]|uniref:maltose alpha-D-glucosyltransferase n=2 Tax=Corynebacterium flavescens TaxID=28028 RepID=A0A1L7CK83_CORFL|nr:alpha-amylase family protein [Corynebacterium flavescens]APT86257.1 trehalose synthase [Corynebacterium flavescens]KAA8724520.1 trehalose synthase [Corynebacterium flavescens]MDN6099121.1 alpha-amylase family protein [Corynebacterium flavescens]MDN6200243.1 alpha-amylase family protein [Corynebacterium flavescens]MDN6226461.1 alpha-amylase family protein [Corynebacterium flavescens]